MNIKTIVDKIIKEADIQAQDYSVADRLIDVNFEYLYLVEKSVQIGSRIPASRSLSASAEAVSETFTVVDGSNTFHRTIKDVAILRVDFMATGASRYEPMRRDESRVINGYCISEQKVFFDEKRAFVENGIPGTMRVTYARGTITPFTTVDYDAGTPPSPDFLPETFQPLLWLEPAATMAEYYKKDRAKALRDKQQKLYTLFENHYGRDSIRDLEIVTDEEDSSCFGGNSRR